MGDAGRTLWLHGRTPAPLLRVVFLSTSHGCPLKPACRHWLKCPHLTGGDIVDQKNLVQGPQLGGEPGLSQALPLINSLQGRLHPDL